MHHLNENMSRPRLGHSLPRAFVILGAEISAVKEPGDHMNFSSRIQNISPVRVLFIFLMVKVALGLGSTTVQVNIASFPAPYKQLGYFSEIN